MAYLVVQIILNVIAVVTGFFGAVCFVIGFIDDKDFYIPAVIWFMLTVGAIAMSYLLTHQVAG